MRCGYWPGRTEPLEQKLNKGLAGTAKLYSVRIHKEAINHSHTQTFEESNTDVWGTSVGP